MGVEEGVVPVSSWTTRLKLLGSALTTLGTGRAGAEGGGGKEEGAAGIFFRTEDGLLILEDVLLTERRPRSCMSIVAAAAMESTHTERGGECL